MLLRLGAAREEVHLASRSRKGCWRMSANSILQAALTNEWLDQQGVPNLQDKNCGSAFITAVDNNAGGDVIRSEPSGTTRTPGGVGAGS